MNVPIKKKTIYFTLFSYLHYTYDYVIIIIRNSKLCNSELSLQPMSVRSKRINMEEFCYII